MPGATSAFTSAGSEIAICNGLPATFDQAGFSAVGMVYTEIGEVTDIPDFGPERNVVTHLPIKSKIVRKRAGSINYGSLTLGAALVPGDAGHVKVLTGLEDSDPQSFRVTYPDGTIEYFTAIVTSYKRNLGNADSITAAAIGLEIDSAITTVYPV